MQNQELSQDKKHSYDEEIVLYCKSCLSLRIVDIPNFEDSDYCEICGSTNIGECDIKEWESMYKIRYGRLFVDRK